MERPAFPVVETISRADVNFRGPVDIQAMLDYDSGQNAAIPKRDRVVQVCQSDHMFEWVHAFATTLISSEKAVIGGLTAAEHLRMWQKRIKILANPPWRQS